MTLSDKLRMSGRNGGTGTYVSLDARIINRGEQYRGTVRLLPSGQISAIIYRYDHGNAVIIGKEKFLPTRYVANTPLVSRFTAMGSFPTRLSLTVRSAIRGGSSVTVTATDSKPDLQAAGGVGTSQGRSHYGAHGCLDIRFAWFRVATY